MEASAVVGCPVVSVASHSSLVNVVLVDETVEVGSVVGTGFVVIVGLGGAAVVVGCPCVWIASQSCPGDVAEVDVVGLILVITTGEKKSSGVEEAISSGLVELLGVVIRPGHEGGLSTSLLTKTF